MNLPQGAAAPGVPTLQPPGAVTGMFPGFGFFGPTASSGASIPLGALIEGLRLVVRAREPEYLNITGLQVRDAADKPVEFTRENCKARFSSVLEDDGARFGPGMFFSRKRGELHTQKEREPWIELLFAEPLRVKEISILNRADRWGQRNRHLCAEVLVDGGWLQVWRNGSPACADELLRIARRWVGERLLDARPGEMSGEEARELVGRALLDAADSPLLERLVTGGARQLMAFFDFYGEKPATERELRLLGAFLAHFVRRDGVVRNFSFIQALVPDERRMRELQDAVNHYGARLAGGKRAIFTRHGLRGAVLLEQRDAYLTLMRGVIDAVSELGVPCSLLYGSLLGAVREGGFIAHDDDVDLCFYVDAANAEEAAREVERVSAHLLAKGFKVVKNPTLNRHVIGKVPRVAVDLFPGWISNGRLHVYMERMGIRDIDAGIVLPLSTLELHGQEFPAPACPERFLEERYGAGWRIADPYFEWPYPLERSGAAGPGKA